jgi:hypothetical protein
MADAIEKMSTSPFGMGFMVFLDTSMLKAVSVAYFTQTNHVKNHQKEIIISNFDSYQIGQIQSQSAASLLTLQNDGQEAGGHVEQQTAPVADPSEAFSLFIEIKINSIYKGFGSSSN